MRPMGTITEAMPAHAKPVWATWSQHGTNMDAYVNNIGPYGGQSGADMIYYGSNTGPCEAILEPMILLFILCVAQAVRCWDLWGHSW